MTKMTSSRSELSEEPKKQRQKTSGLFESALVDEESQK